MNLQLRTALIIWALLSLVNVNAQIDWPLLSQPGELRQTMGNTAVEITYERPSVRGREIFGGLVPWGEVWRTGAGVATTISFDREVWLDGHAVEAGKYALFTIPEPDCWTVILNRDTDLYGAGKYQSANDQIRFQVPSTTAGRHYESVTINIDIVNNNGHFYLNWDDVQVAFPITTTTDQEVKDFIYGEMRLSPDVDAQTLAMAASYLHWNNGDPGHAHNLARRANMDGSQPWAGLLEAEILTNFGQHAAAIKVVKDLIRLRKNNPYDDPRETVAELAELEQKIIELEQNLADSEKPLHLVIINSGDGC